MDTVQLTNYEYFFNIISNNVRYFATDCEVISHDNF